MKKVLSIVMIFVFLFFGIKIGMTSSEKQNLEERLEEFESKIIDPNNNYVPKNEMINPNIIGSIGKKVEVIIDKSFSVLKKVIKKIVD